VTYLHKNNSTELTWKMLQNTWSVVNAGSSTGHPYCTLVPVYFAFFGPSYSIISSVDPTSNSKIIQNTESACNRKPVNMQMIISERRQGGEEKKFPPSHRDFRLTDAIGLTSQEVLLVQRMTITMTAQQIH